MSDEQDIPKLGEPKPSAGFMNTIDEIQAMLKTAGIESFILFAKDPDTDVECNLHIGSLSWRLGASELIKNDILEIALRAGKIGGKNNY